LIVDSSAILAILLKEAGWERLVEKVAGSSVAGVGTPTLVETGIVLASRVGTDAGRLLSLFLAESAIAPVPFGEAHWRKALEAHRRYGRGRHRAGLNFGDCMSYAMAKLAGQPLLCTGEDFAKTDLELA
jgi:ribonuclease VapC